MRQFWPAGDTCLPVGTCVRVDDAIEPGWDRYGQGLVDRIDVEQRVFVLRGPPGTLGLVRKLEVAFAGVKV